MEDETKTTKTKERKGLNKYWTALWISIVVMALFTSAYTFWNVLFMGVYCFGEPNKVVITLEFLFTIVGMALTTIFVRSEFQ